MNTEILFPKCEAEDCFLCKNVSPEWLELIRLKRSVEKFPKGTRIFNEGDEVDGIYFILRGKVKVTTSWGENKEFLVRLATDGTILGHRGYGVNTIYPISGVTLEETETCFIPSELFWKIVRANPRLHEALTRFYADELKNAEQRLKHLALSPVINRVAESLLIMKDAFGTDDHGLIAYNMSRKDLASMSGTTYETVIRMLNQLREKGLISFKKNAITVLNEQALVDLSGYKKISSIN